MSATASRAPWNALIGCHTVVVDALGFGMGQRVSPRPLTTARLVAALYERAAA